MQFVPTRVHGAIDHLAAAILLCMPWMLGLSRATPETLTLVAAGIAIGAAALMTNYEWGLIRRIPVPVHSAIDLLIGLSLAASPWLLGFADTARGPHMLLGVLLILGALTTQPRPFGLDETAIFAARLAAESPAHGRR